MAPMDVREVVSVEAGASTTPGEDTCPRCGEAPGRLPPVTAASLGKIPIRRCVRCGARFTAERSHDRLLFSCEQCGIPFLADELLPHADHRCPECEDGRVPAPLPDEPLARATEGEVRAALADRWKLVGSGAPQAYLDRIARQVADRIEGAPANVDVLLVDDAAHRTLALPSGSLLVSVGTLLFLADEAELAFVLGHEIAHAASGDAAVRLVRLGFLGATRGADGHDAEAWADAALDLVRLGYGRRRERDADARAIEAVLALGYEPESALRYLRRVQIRVDLADPAFAEQASSHPIAIDRIRRIERALYGRVKEDGVLKVNRELFRRVCGREALSSTLLGREWREQAAGHDAAGDAEPARGGTRFVRVVLALAALSAAALGIAWYVTR
jgi:hypothetical protein